MLIRAKVLFKSGQSKFRLAVIHRTSSRVGPGGDALEDRPEIKEPDAVDGSLVCQQFK